MANHRSSLPAFPCEADGGCGPWPGMTMLEYAAIHLLSGSMGTDTGSMSAEEIMKGAVKAAEMLFDELEKGKGE